MSDTTSTEPSYSLTRLARILNVENPDLHMTRRRLETYWKYGLKVAHIGGRYYVRRSDYDAFIASRFSPEGKEKA